MLLNLKFKLKTIVKVLLNFASPRFKLKAYQRTFYVMSLNGCTNPLFNSFNYKKFFIMMLAMTTLASCTFKKKGYEEEQERVRQEAIQSGAFSQKEVTRAFAEGPNPKAYHYEAGLRIPTRFKIVKIKIDRIVAPANENRDEVLETILEDDAYSLIDNGYLVRFKAKAEDKFKISILPVGVLATNPVEFAMEAPKDLVIPSGRTVVTDKNFQLFKNLGRLFISDSAVISIERNILNIQAQKIIVRGVKSYISMKASRQIFGLNEQTPAKLLIEADEVIGQLRVELEGITGANGANGKPLVPHPVSKIGSDADYDEVRESYCRRGPGGVTLGCGTIELCVRSPGDGENGRDELLGNNGDDGQDGGVAADLEITIHKALNRGKISYVNTSGPGGAPGIASANVPASAGGGVFPIKESGYYRRGQCQNAKPGRPGKSIAEQNAEKIAAAGGKKVSLFPLQPSNGKPGIGRIEKEAVIIAPEEAKARIRFEPRIVALEKDESEIYQFPVAPKE